MDAISFVASVAQLAGAGLTISKALYEYASSVSNAPKKLNDLARDIQLTSSVLSHLSEVFAEATMRAFVRPGALHTAKDAIAGCSEIFGEMESLIKEGKGSFGKFILPFKESKIQLLNARLASLKSTLQLLLQVLQYASSVNIDPGVSQVSLTGSWVMSQFKTLIDEREEARRNYEQLKAEIGSIKSAFSEPLNESSTKAELNPSEEAEGDIMKISSAQPHQHGIKPYKPESQNSPVHASASTTSAPAVAAPNSSTKQNEPNLTPINPEKPSTNHHTSKSGSAKEVAKIILLSFGAVLCCPCLPIYIYVCVRRSGLKKASFGELQPVDVTAAELVPYPYESAYNAYQNLDTYGPAGVFELSGQPQLPAPAPLGSSYFAEVDRPVGVFEAPGSLELPAPAPLGSSYLAEVDRGRY